MESRIRKNRNTRQHLIPQVKYIVFLDGLNNNSKQSQQPKPTVTKEKRKNSLIVRDSLTVITKDNDVNNEDEITLTEDDLSETIIKRFINLNSSNKSEISQIDKNRIVDEILRIHKRQNVTEQERKELYDRASTMNIPKIARDMAKDYILEQVELINDACQNKKQDEKKMKKKIQNSFVSYSILEKEKMNEIEKSGEKKQNLISGDVLQRIEDEEFAKVYDEVERVRRRMISRASSVAITPAVLVKARKNEVEDGINDDVTSTRDDENKITDHITTEETNVMSIRQTNSLERKNKIFPTSIESESVSSTSRSSQSKTSSDHSSAIDSSSNGQDSLNTSNEILKDVAACLESLLDSSDGMESDSKPLENYRRLNVPQIQITSSEDVITNMNKQLLMLKEELLAVCDGASDSKLIEVDSKGTEDYIALEDIRDFIRKNHGRSKDSSGTSSHYSYLFEDRKNSFGSHMLSDIHRVSSAASSDRSHLSQFFRKKSFEDDVSNAHSEVTTSRTSLFESNIPIEGHFTARSGFSDYNLFSSPYDSMNPNSSSFPNLHSSPHDPTEDLAVKRRLSVPTNLDVVHELTTARSYDTTKHSLQEHRSRNPHLKVLVTSNISDWMLSFDLMASYSNKASEANLISESNRQRDTKRFRDENTSDGMLYNALEIPSRNESLSKFFPQIHPRSPSNELLSPTKNNKESKTNQLQESVKLKLTRQSSIPQLPDIGSPTYSTSPRKISSSKRLKSRNGNAVVDSDCVSSSRLLQSLSSLSVEGYLGISLDPMERTINDMESSLLVNRESLSTSSRVVTPSSFLKASTASLLSEINGSMREAIRQQELMAALHQSLDHLHRNLRKFSPNSSATNSFCSSVSSPRPSHHCPKPINPVSHKPTQILNPIFLPTLTKSPRDHSNFDKSTLSLSSINFMTTPSGLSHITDMKGNVQDTLIAAAEAGKAAGKLLADMISRRKCANT